MFDSTDKKPFIFGKNLFFIGKIHLYYRNRIPSCASLTVEASLVLPIFLFAVLSVCYMGLLVKTQDEVRHVMTRIVSEASAETFGYLRTVRGRYWRDRRG